MEAHNMATKVNHESIQDVVRVKDKHRPDGFYYTFSVLLPDGRRVNCISPVGDWCGVDRYTGLVDEHGMETRDTTLPFAVDVGCWDVGTKDPLGNPYDYQVNEDGTRTGLQNDTH